MDSAALKRFVGNGGKVFFAAGLSIKPDENIASLLQIKQKGRRKYDTEFSFVNPLFPVQPDDAFYDGGETAYQLKTGAGVTVFLEDKKEKTPLLYTCDFRKGKLCLLNGTFLSDMRYMGLLTGAVNAMQEDFLYPALGLKVVFLDHFPMSVFEDEEGLERVYGISVEGISKDIIWPLFQGMHLRNDAPYTASILAAAEDTAAFPTANPELFSTLGKSCLQFGGEQAYGADISGEKPALYDEKLTARMKEAFRGYQVASLTLSEDGSLPDPEPLGADISFVRGSLQNPALHFKSEDGMTVFPAATYGNDMENGNLFALYSTLSAYGIVSHVFDLHSLLAEKKTDAPWDLYKEELGLFESEILSRTHWLSGVTLSQTASAVQSYLQLDYAWEKENNVLRIEGSGMAKGQAFFYHTNASIESAQGLSFLEIGNGYYLIRMEENQGVIVLVN